MISNFVGTLFIHKWKASGVVAPDVIACAWQVLGLRRALLSILAEYPANIFDPELVAKVTLRHTNALPVWFFPKGVEQLPSGWERLIGWTGEGRKWIWAAIPKPANWPPASAALAIPDIRPWCNILDQFAPLAKLMMKGLRHRTAIGPELRFIESMLVYKCNVEVRFEPPFDRPPHETHPGAFVFEILGSEQEECDVCHQKTGPSEAKVVSPWNSTVSFAKKYGTFVGEQLLLVLPADTEDARRDWSATLICRQCLEEFRRIGVIEA